MDHHDLPAGPDVDRLKVPEDLLRQLHDANARLQAARRHLEEAMDETELIFRHEQNVEDHFGEVRKAEKDVEEISKKIQEILGRKV
jgi:predicted  nucleic acid-binding Zn-ribbon protein